MSEAPQPGTVADLLLTRAAGFVRVQCPQCPELIELHGRPRFGDVDGTEVTAFMDVDLTPALEHVAAHPPMDPAPPEAPITIEPPELEE